MRKLLLGGVALVCVSLGACSSQQETAAIGTVQGAFATAQALLNTACSASANVAPTVIANPTLAPVATNLFGWLGGACVKGQATASLINNALNDPNGIQNTVNWTTNLINSVKAAVKS